MNSPSKLIALLFAGLLAGCQHPPSRTMAPPADVSPPVMGAQAARTSPLGTPQSGTPQSRMAQSGARQPGAPQSGVSHSATPQPGAGPALARNERNPAPVITLHLAQERAEQPLVAVDAGGKPLYALPQPVLTQADMARVSPVITKDQRSFILLEMNQNGIPKLQSVSAQARGHYLLLSVQGQLVTVSQISETIADGRLMLNTQSPEHTQAIIKLMQGQK